MCPLKKSDKDLYMHKQKLWSSNINYFDYQSKIIQLIKLIFNPFNWNKISLSFSSYFDFKMSIKNYLKWKFISKHNPDIIYFSFSGIASSYVDSLELYKSIPVVFSCRGSAEKIKPLIDSARKINLKKIIKISDKIHCVSNDMKNSVKKYGEIGDKVFINFPSVEKDFFDFNLRKESKPIKILSTGRLHFQKGYVYSLKAISYLVKKGYEIEYHICGDGPEKGLIKFMIDELKLINNVILHGRVSNQKVKELIADSNIFLLGSVYEGIANAAIEAMMSGLPVVSTKAGGMSELIKNKQNGILTELFSAEQLSDGIEFLINNNENAKTIAKNARHTVVSKFNLENQINIFEKNFLELISE